MLMCCYHVEIALLRVACSSRKKSIFVILKKTDVQFMIVKKKNENVKEILPLKYPDSVHTNNR